MAALGGILLVAANLRSAVAALSPIIVFIRDDMELDTFSVAAIGMLPPFCFAVFGLLTPLLTRRIGLENAAIVSMTLIVAGHLGRGLAPGSEALVTASVIVFAGLGLGNVLLPPLVKRYFPDSVGRVTAVYATVIPIGTLVPPLIAVPVASGSGWRVSLGMWALLAVLAMVPWAYLAVTAPRRRDSPIEERTEWPGRELRVMLGSPSTWGLTILFAISALNAYSLFAWLPLILVEEGGLSSTGAGTMLSLFAAMGIVSGLTVPVLATRWRSLSGFVLSCIAAFTLGYLGLLLMPAVLGWIWLVMAGLGQFLFPLVIVLIGLRSHGRSQVLLLSGLVQGVGYTVGALGPLAVGLLYAASGGWTVPLTFLMLTTVVLGVAASLMIDRPHPVAPRGGSHIDPGGA